MILTELFENGTLFALTGALAGLLSGLLGIGGGIVIVPALAFLFKHNANVPSTMIMHFAAGTSLLIMIITSQSAIRTHYRLGEILWPVFHKLWPGIVVGTLLGALVADLIPSQWLRVFFGLFLLFVAYRMFSSRHQMNTFHSPKPWINNVISLLIGFKSGMLGIGGGVLIIPYLTWCGVDVRKIAPVTGLCTLTIAVVGSMAFMITGYNDVGISAYSIGYVYWPAALWIAIPSAMFAQLGARLTYKVPVQQLKYGFIVFLLITAVDMLV